MEKFSTTFRMDFRIADHFGNYAIKDTFKRAFKEWKDDVRYCADLCITMNQFCWFWYGRDNNRSQMYADYYYKVREYGLTTFKGEDAEYFFEKID